MKKLQANGLTVIVSSPAKSCPDLHAFPHGTVTFGYSLEFPDTQYLGVVWTLKDGNQYLYRYQHASLANAAILQPLIDGCNLDGCFFNHNVRPYLFDKQLD